ncbi:MAG: biopolymer transporter ExbD [Phycisphaerales bacterium]|nr:biopolymer transporter ExbD [Phycisphaerales bacterium]
MSMKLRRRSVFDKGNQRSGPMMTPMVDVVLVILIFFMASTTIAGYEWFLEAGVEAESAGEERAIEARFDLPAAVIEVDLVRIDDGATMVYGLSGESGITLDSAIGLIGGMDIAEGGSLRVALGAGDSVSMRDVVAVHDAWNMRGVRVVMRADR